MQGFEKKDFCPAIMDYDRYHFLELLLVTGKTLFLSYLGYCVETFKEVEPSILVTQLLKYLDKNFLVGGEKPSKKILFKHPHLSFNAAYFEEKNYSIKNYRLAQSYYQKPKKSQNQCLLTDHEISSSVEKLEEISIQELCLLAKNPILFSMQKKHHIFLSPASIHHENQGFTLEPLQRAIIKKELFSESFLSDNDSLPKGVFKKLAKDALQNESLEMESFLKECGLKTGDLFNVEFRRDISESKAYSEKLWLVPSPKIPLTSKKNIYLTGKLENVSSKGLLCTGDLKIETMLLEFPKYLAYSLLKRLLPLNLSAKWLFSKSRKVKELQIENEEELFKSYFDLYFLCLGQVVPFLPNWIPSFMDEKTEVILKQIRKDISSSHFYNLYAKSIINPSKIQPMMLKTWKALAEQIYRKPYELLKK